MDLGASFGTKQLPFNRGQNPLVAAESFCSREHIHKGNAEQIRHFIIQNAGEDGASGGMLRGRRGDLCGAGRGSAPAAAPSAPDPAAISPDMQQQLEANPLLD